MKLEKVLKCIKCEDSKYITSSNPILTFYAKDDISQSCLLRILWEIKIIQRLQKKYFYSIHRRVTVLKNIQCVVQSILNWGLFCYRISNCRIYQ